MRSTSLNAIKHYLRIRQNVPADSPSADALLCQFDLDAGELHRLWRDHVGIRPRYAGRGASASRTLTSDINNTPPCVLSSYSNKCSSSVLCSDTVSQVCVARGPDVRNALFHREKVLKNLDKVRVDKRRQPNDPTFLLCNPRSLVNRLDEPSCYSMRRLPRGLSEMVTCTVYNPPASPHQDDLLEPNHRNGPNNLEQSIQKQEWLSKQFGSLKGRSTAHYLVSLLYYLSKESDKLGTITTMVMTDFSKAFDRIDDTVATRKLSCLVPQSTILGPIIFLAVFDDAVRETLVQEWKYVDDLCMAKSRHRSKPSVLQSELDKFITSGTGCGGNLTAPSGGPVTSPNYPGNYGNNVNCEWAITVQEGSIIILTFDSFHTERYIDFLTIYDGANDNAAEIERLSGYHSQISPIISTSNTLFLNFTSDEIKSRQGFQFNYTSKIFDHTPQVNKVSLLDTGGSFVVRHQCLTPRQSTLYFTRMCSTAGQCWDPGVPANGNRDNNSNFTSGQTVRYTCMDGYPLRGTANITCQPNGTWSGATPTCGGLVEVRPADSWTWGGVCAKHFDLRDADVVCRMLGYIWANGFYSTLFGKAYGPGQRLAYMADLRCDGNESSLFDCSYAGWGSHDCGEELYVGYYRTYAEVVCDPSRIRLIGGSGPNEGRVEVRPEDSMTWGTVCHNRFNMDNADVVCRMLGYLNATQVQNDAYFGQGWTIHNCDHGQDAGVVCRTDSSRIRLVGGSGPNEGRVEVRPADSSRWGTVCHNGFDLKDAEVVCRMLGYPNVYVVRPFGREATSENVVKDWHEQYINARHSHDCARSVADQPVGRTPTIPENRALSTQQNPVVIAATKNNFKQITTTGTRKLNDIVGGRAGPIYIEDLQCDGTESSLFNCSHEGWRVHDCDHRDDVGVVCGSSRKEGRVEVRPADSMTWGTVCHNQFDIKDADVVCSILGYPSAQLVRNDAYFGPGRGPIYMDDLRCNGDENSLFNCSYPGWTINDLNCSHDQAAGVECTDVSASIH
ncbi:scavenger receptor [Branchiostoma belcheri]|nr:scavenger receptor [Branchiostoma belcheri]